MVISNLESKIDKLAWQWLSQPQMIDLAQIGLEENELLNGCHFEDGRLVFIDREQACERAIRHLQTNEILPFTGEPVRLFRGMNQAYVHSAQARKDSLPDLALARLHNGGALDVLDLADSALAKDPDSLGIARALGSVLPHLENVDIARLLALVDRLAGRGIFALSLPEWLKRRPEMVGEVADLCLKSPTQTLAMVLRFALIVGASVDRPHWLRRIHTLINDPNPLVANESLEALGRVDWAGTPSEEIGTAVSAIRRGLASMEEARLRTAVMAGLNLVSSAPEYHPLIDEIIRIDASFITGYVGDQLGYAMDHWRDQAWFLPKIDLLATKASQEPGRFGGVDAVLARRYESDKTSSLAWLETWVQANAFRDVSLPRDLPSLFAAIAGDEEERGALLARWLIHDQLGAQLMAASFLDELDLLEVRGVTFAAKALDAMDMRALLHLVRRTIAHVWRDEHRVTLVWSLTGMSLAEQRSYELVREAMVDYVGYDFPGATDKHLKAIVEREALSPLGTLAATIIKQLDDYYSALDALPRVEEILPPSEDQKLFAKERMKKSDQAAEEANRNSVARQLFSQVPVKAGRSTFSIRDGVVSAPSEMNSYTHSMAIPRSEIIDKVGAALCRNVFILQKAGAK